MTEPMADQPHVQRWWKPWSWRPGSWRPATWLVLVACTNLLSTGIFLIASAMATDDAVDAAVKEIIDDRSASRATSCGSYNVDTVDKVNGILIQLAIGSRDPDAAKALVEPLLLAHRRCDEDGIADYFDGDPNTDPFIPSTIEEYIP